MNSKTLKQQVESSDSASFWLKNMMQSIDERDICDAIRDVTFLKKYLELKFRETLEHNKNIIERK